MDKRPTTLDSQDDEPLIDIRRTGRIFGWLFIGTFVTSIPARLLFIHAVGASWTDMRFVPGKTSTSSLKLGAQSSIGGSLLILSFVLILCGVYKNGSSASQLLGLPEAGWELSLGIYCAWKGFRPESYIVRPQEMAVAHQRQPAGR